MLELQTMTWMDFTVSKDVEADLNSVKDVVAGNSDFYETSKRYRHKLGHEVPINLAVWKYPKDIGEQLLCFIVEAPKTSSSHREFTRVIEILEKRIDKMERDRRSGVNVNVGDQVTGDKSGRDKITNDANIIKFLVGALIAMAAAMTWIAYYNSDAADKVPPPTTIIGEDE
jgi:hypothetical protein